MTYTDETKEAVTGRQKAILLVVYSLLIVLRYPWLLLHGRLWGEEGTVYLHSAWSSSVPATLFSPHLGYYALWPNFCALLAARVFPLPAAALVLVWCAFLVQVLAGYLMVQCEAFGTVKVKALALAILLLAAPSRQVWLNTINSQFYLVACVAIVFLSRTDRRLIQRNFVLLLAALTGPVTTFLTPFFLLRAVLRKTKSAYVQAGILTACAVTQLIVVRESLHAGVRHINFQPSGVTPEFLVQYLAMPFFSRQVKRVVASLVLAQGRSTATGHSMMAHLKLAIMSVHLPLTWPFLLLWAMIDIAFLCLLAWITYNRSDRSSWWLLAMSVWLAFFSIYGALDGTYKVGERYVFPSAVLMGLSLLPAAVKASDKARKIAAVFLLACFLISGALDYISYPEWVTYVRAPGPDWSTEAHQWEQNPNRELIVWPIGFKRFTLSPDHR